jgi:hypothetical protein
MDIDVASRLMHEKHLAEVKYFKIGSRNSYGLTILESKELDFAFNEAKKEQELAQFTLDFYLINSCLESARHQARYFVYTHNI